MFPRRTFPILLLFIALNIVGIVWLGRTPPRRGPGLRAALAKAESVHEEGKLLFVALGCSACHGLNGAGGVRNPNSITETVPALDTMADRMLLFEREEAEAVLALLEAEVDLEAVEESPFPRFTAFRAQFKSVCHLIGEGRESAALDPAAPSPPLVMPRWQERVDERQIHALMAYLITLQDWES